jgi:hypothetical protein
MQTCPNCGAVLPNDPAGASAGLLPVAAPPAPLLPIPERWEVQSSPRALTVRWRWFKAMGVVLIPFALIWNGMLLGMGVSATDNFAHPEKLVYGLFIPHVWVGLALGYFVLATLFNSSTVAVQLGRVTVKHGPLPWLGARDQSTTEFKQFFVLEKRGSKGSVSYELCALLRDGRKQSFVSGITAEQARFLEVKLEQALGIQDVPVDGELHRG